MQLAAKLSEAIRVAEYRLKLLRGLREPPLLERVETILRDHTKSCNMLQRCVQLAAEQKKFQAAATAQTDLRQRIEENRRRLVIAFDRAVESDDTGTYSVQELSEAWRRIETEAPASHQHRVQEQRAQEHKTVLKGLSPRPKNQPKEIGCPAVDKFARSKRGRRVNKKLDRI